MCALPPSALRRVRPGFGAVGRRPAALLPAGCGLSSGAFAAATDLPPALTGPQVSALACALLGLSAFLFWWRRRDDPAWLLFSAVALVGVLQGVQDPAGGAAAVAWAQAGTAWLLALTGFFSWRLAGVRPLYAERALLACAAAASVAALPLWPWPTGRFPGLLDAVMAAALALNLSLQAWRRGTPEPAVAASAAWVTLGLAMHDLWHPGPSGAAQAPGWMLLAPLVWSGVFLYALQRRCQAALADPEPAHAGPRSAPEAPPPWRETERQQAVQRERQRLMRDLHDGAGSALMSALVLVEHGRLEARAVADLLRECMDDIRLVIDSMEPVEHDLVALLASLRYRLGRRMELSGVRLVWQVQDVPALAWMDAGAALQILRIVQESLTNVLKHAQAQSVVLGVALHQDGERPWVRVTIADDGCGFDLSRLDGARPGGGRGLHNLRSRARALQGRLVIGSRPGGTEITLDLPVSAGPDLQGTPLADRPGRIRGARRTAASGPAVLTERHE